MITIDYSLENRSNLLVQISDNAPLQGARVRSIEGERTVISEVLLTEAMKPVDRSDEAGCRVLPGTR